MVKKLFLVVCLIGCFFANMRARSVDATLEKIMSCDSSDVQAFCEQLSSDEKHELQEHVVHVCDEFIEKCEAGYVTAQEIRTFQIAVRAFWMIGLVAGVTQSYELLAAAFGFGIGALGYYFHLDRKIHRRKQQFEQRSH